MTDAATVRDQMIAAGILRPGPHPPDRAHPSFVTRCKLDARGRREAAKTIWQECHWQVPRLLQDGEPWLRAELERLAGQYGARAA